MLEDSKRQSVRINIEQDRNRAGDCIDNSIYKAFRLFRFGVTAMFSNWAGIMASRYSTTPVDSENYQKNYELVMISISMMLVTCLGNCIWEFIREKRKIKPVIDTLGFTAAFFVVGLTGEYLINSFDRSCSFVDRVNSNNYNLTENALNQSGI